MSIDTSNLLNKTLDLLNSGETVKFGFFVEYDSSDEYMINKAKELQSTFESKHNMKLKLAGNYEIKHYSTESEVFTTIKFYVKKS